MLSILIIMFNLLSYFTPNSPCQGNIPWFDGSSSSVDSSQICVFEKTHQVRLSCFLECKNSSALETEAFFELLSNFPNKSLERNLSYKQIRRPLVFTYLFKGCISRTVPVFL